MKGYESDEHDVTCEKADKKYGSDQITRNENGRSHSMPKKLHFIVQILNT